VGWKAKPPLGAFDLENDGSRARQTVASRTQDRPLDPAPLRSGAQAFLSASGDAMLTLVRRASQITASALATLQSRHRTTTNMLMSPHSDILSYSRNRVSLRARMRWDPLLRWDAKLPLGTFGRA